MKSSGLLKNLNISKKITVFVLSVSILSLLVFLLTIQFNIQREMSNSMRLIDSLKHEASDESRRGLEEQAKKYLARLVTAQAENSNNIFKTIETQIRMATDYAEEVWNNSDRYDSSDFRKLEETVENPELHFYYSAAPGVDTEELTDEIRMLGNLGTVFRSIVYNNKTLELLPVAIDGVYMGTESGLFFNMTWYAYFSEEYDARKRPWYENAKNRKDVGWSEIYIDIAFDDYAITCYSPVYDDTGTLKGVIGIDVMINAMIDIITSQTKEIGDIFLVDNEGDILTYAKADADLQAFLGDSDNISESINIELSEMLPAIQRGENGIREITYGDEVRLLGFAPVDSTDWSIVALASTEEIIEYAEKTGTRIEAAGAIMQNTAEASFNNTALMILFSFFGIVIIAVLISYHFSKRITKPISLLREGVEKIGSGNLDETIEVDTGDELQLLADTYNKMTVELKKYIEDLQKTTAAKQSIESELLIASKIQTSMLPRIFPPFPDRKEFDIYAVMTPAKEVGGDFYDFFLVDEDKLCFVVGDVSGKGVPASLFMVISKTLIKNEVLRGLPVDEVFYKVNNLLCEDNDESLFVTTFIGILHLKTGELEYCNAGHNPPLMYKYSDNKFAYMKINNGFILGGMEDINYKHEKTQMETGDIIFVYTDGVTEATDALENLYSEARLEQTLNSTGTKDVTALIKTVLESINDFVSETPQSDDITMLAVKIVTIQG